LNGKNCVFLGFLFAALVGPSGAFCQTKPFSLPALKTAVPWSDSDLIQPAKLAAMLRPGSSHQPLILNIGVMEDIKASTHIGPVSKEENLSRLTAQINRLPKNTFIVFYCGCCPFAKCPNIRPAFLALKKAGFTQAKLLNLPQNLNVDWIKAGYPLKN